jgi:hypothetical protein
LKQEKADNNGTKDGMRRVKELDQRDISKIVYMVFAEQNTYMWEM